MAYTQLPRLPPHIGEGPYIHYNALLRYIENGFVGKSFTKNRFRDLVHDDEEIHDGYHKAQKIDGSLEFLSVRGILKKRGETYIIPSALEKTLNAELRRVGYTKKSMANMKKLKGPRVYKEWKCLDS